MSRRLLVPTLLAAAACHDPDEEFGSGVAVGNPTKGMTVRVVPDDDVRALRGKADVATLAVLGCDGADAVVVAEDFVLPPAGRRVALPGGTFCGTALTFDSWFTLDGRFAGGGSFALDLDVGDVSVVATAPFSTTTGELLLQLGPAGWLGEAALGVAAGDSLAVVPGDARHDELVAQVRGRSRLVVDADLDGKGEDGEEVVAWGPDEDPSARGRGARTP